VLGLGDTFLVPKSSLEIEHLWIIITDRDPITHEAVCVNVTTLQVGCEKTVIVIAKEHPFVTHDSVIRYADAKKLDLRKVEAALDAQCTTFVCEQKEKCSPAFLKRVQDGLLQSRTAPKGIKEHCKQQWQGKKGAKSEIA
jgi:hypothetical protein